MRRFILLLFVNCELNTKYLSIERDINTEQKICTCSYFDKAFSFDNKCEEHQMVPNDDIRYFCHHYNKSFSQTCNLHLNNYMRIHSGEKPYRCNQCEKYFAIFDNLKRHLRTHTRKKPYQCKFCEKILMGNANVTKHMWRHAGEKPCRCRNCDKCFHVIAIFQSQKDTY